jgi:hypothetical protein
MEHIMTERKSLINQAKSLRTHHDQINLQHSTNAEIAIFIERKKNEMNLNSLLENYSSSDDRISAFKKEYEDQYSAFHQSSFLTLKSAFIDKLMSDSIFSSVRTEDEEGEGGILQVDSLFCCPICQDEEKGIHLKLPCGHEFHWLCFVKCDNMMKKHECAMCRLKMNLKVESDDVVRIDDGFKNLMNSVRNL